MLVGIVRLFADKEKGSPKKIGNCPFVAESTAEFRSRCASKLLGHSLGVLGAELFNAAGFNDTRLSARVERVAGGGRIELEHRVGHAVDFNRFARLNGGRDDERLVDGHVDKSDFAIFGVNAFLHFSKIPSLSVGRPDGLTSRPDGFRVL